MQEVKIFIQAEIKGIKTSDGAAGYLLEAQTPKGPATMGRIYHIDNATSNAAELAALLDALVLAIVKKEDTYGYEITRVLKNELDVSESTLYPVLRRLQKDDCLEIYDKEYSGRNRRYYKITDRGRKQLDMYRDEWQNYKATITNIFEGVIDDE